MRIAHLSPIDERVPPRTYGGTERIVHYLTETQVAMGHDVTLFASADSPTSAKLEPVCPESLRLSGRYDSRYAYLCRALESVARLRTQFDIVHVHIEYIHLPLFRHLKIPSVTTLHNRLDLPGVAEAYEEFADMPLVSISDAQRSPLTLARWAGTVYHGLPRNLYQPGSGAGGYLAFLGRMNEEKGVGRAIEIAKRVGMKLKIAAKVDFDCKQYFEEKIQPQLDHPLIEYIGEIGEEEKEEFLGNAKALLFPISWPEPFGLTMIEAMACGTPVVAFDAGSVREVMLHGRTGYIVRDIDEAVHAVERIGQVSRQQCRSIFEQHFTAQRMAEDYDRVYEEVLQALTAPFFRKRVLGL